MGWFINMTIESFSMGFFWGFIALLFLLRASVWENKYQRLRTRTYPVPKNLAKPPDGYYVSHGPTTDDPEDN